MESLLVALVIGFGILIVGIWEMNKAADKISGQLDDIKMELETGFGDLESELRAIQSEISKQPAKE